MLDPVIAVICLTTFGGHGHPGRKTGQDKFIAPMPQSGAMWLGHAAAKDHGQWAQGSQLAEHHVTIHAACWVLAEWQTC